MGDLDGRVAVVVGLDAETAEAVTTALAARGADVAVAGDEQADAVRISREVGDVLQELGRIDVVIAPVGLAIDAGTAGDSAFDSNCDRMLYLSRALVGAGHQVRLRDAVHSTPAGPVPSFAAHN